MCQSPQVVGSKLNETNGFVFILFHAQPPLFGTRSGQIRTNMLPPPPPQGRVRDASRRRVQDMKDNTFKICFAIFAVVAVAGTLR